MLVVIEPDAILIELIAPVPTYPLVTIPDDNVAACNVPLARCIRLICPEPILPLKTAEFPMRPDWTTPLVKVIP